MPDSGLAVYQQIERPVDEIRDVSWRDDAICARGYLVTRSQRTKGVVDKIVLVPGTEKGAGPYYEGFRVDLQHAALSLGLARAIDAGGDGGSVST